MVTRRRFLGSTALLSSLIFSESAKALVTGEPSRTARSTAMQRAAHQLLESPRVFEDPVALRIFGAQGVAWINFYHPGPLAEELRASGYSAARTLGSEEMNERYFRFRSDGFRLYGSGHMMTAQV
jgi:hypothetical protein